MKGYSYTLYNTLISASEGIVLMNGLEETTVLLL